MSHITKETHLPSKFENFILHNVCDGDVKRCGELADHGADSGYGYITYTSDILDVFERYASQIEDIVGEFLEGCGETIATAFVWYCDTHLFTGTHTEYVTYLVWSAAEIVARELGEQRDIDDEPKEEMELDDET